MQIRVLRFECFELLFARNFDLMRIIEYFGEFDLPDISILTEERFIVFSENGPFLFNIVKINGILNIKICTAMPLSLV